MGAPLRVRAAAVVPDHAEEPVRAYERYYDAHEGQVTTFPGVPNMLRAPRERGLPLAVVTSKRRQRAVKTLERLGELFDCVVAEEDSPRPKPAPDPVYRVWSLVFTLVSFAVAGVAFGRIEP